MYEQASERWSPVQSVEKVILSVISMLAGALRCGFSFPFSFLPHFLPFDSFLDSMFWMHYHGSSVPSSGLQARIHPHPYPDTNHLYLRQSRT